MIRLACLYRGAIPPKWKGPVRIIGRLWVTPKCPHQIRVGTVVVPLHRPTHLALSLHAGVRQIVPAEYPPTHEAT